TLVGHEVATSDAGATVTARLMVEGKHVTVTGAGNGPIAAFVHALQKDLAIDVEVVDYAEHAITAGSDASAAAYVEARSEDGIRWGVGLDVSILAASLKAVLGAVNRLRGLQPCDHSGGTARLQGQRVVRRGTWDVNEPPPEGNLGIVISLEPPYRSGPQSTSGRLSGPG